MIVRNPTFRSIWVFQNSSCFKFKGFDFPAQFRPTKFSLLIPYWTSSRKGMRRGKAPLYARSIIIHPAHYPPAPSTSQPLLLRPVVPGSILLPRIRRDGNLAESFAIYDGANAPPPARTYFGLYASKMNSVICRSLDNDITDTAAYASAKRARRKGKRRASERARTMVPYFEMAL